jgi:alanine racemase
MQNYLYTVSNIATIVGGSLLGKSNHPIKFLETDSRKIRFPEEAAFFCLQSEQRNGHQFIESCYNYGVRCFVISNLIDVTLYPNAAFILVDNVLNALQNLAALHRKQFNYPIIGITGSNGKTIVKEWINHLLQATVKIIRSPKSYNSQIGVPLSVWQLAADFELGIFEAGISKVGEMINLMQIIQPTIGILTHMGDAHNEGFSSFQEKILEKLQLFQNAEVIIYNHDNIEVKEVVENWQKQHSIKSITVGTNETADFYISSINQTVEETCFKLYYHGVVVECIIPFIGNVAIENVLLASATAIYMGCSPPQLVERLANLPTLAMRLEMKMGINNCTIINDSYSADYSALQSALEFLSQQPQNIQKTIILSDVLQSGIPEKQLYSQIANMLPRYGVSRLIGIGTTLYRYQALFLTIGINTEMYLNTLDFIHQFKSDLFREETILLKGARSFHFEQINQLLEIKTHQTVLTINLTAISHNLMVYKKSIPPGVKLMVMVKALSYGSGTYEIASLLQFHKVDYLSVAYTDEGVDLRKAGINLPIMVMNPEETSFPSLIKYNLEPEIFSLELFYSFQQFLRNKQIENYPIHIKIDTGMHRLGFEEDDMLELVSSLKSDKFCRVKSVFSHLAGSENPLEDEYTHLQNELFISASSKLRKALGYDFLQHISNTAAIRRHPGLVYDMVRLGIGLYGIDTSMKSLGLQEATVLTTTIAQIRKRKAGDTIGYNRAGKLENDAIIATIRIGYADGYPISLGLGKGYVLIHNQRAPIVGKVCMDMMMVDITNIANVKIGDEVELYGKGIALPELAKMAGTIPYNVMTGISPRVKRVYYEE